MRVAGVLPRGAKSLIVAAGLVVGLLGPSSIASPLTSSAAARAQAAPLAAPTTALVTGVTVQNLSASSPATVEIHFYSLDSGAEVPGTAISGVTLPPLGQQTWYVPTKTSLPSGFIGSAVVSSDQPVAAIINTEAPTSTGTSPSDPFRVGTTAGVDLTQIGSTLYVPQIMRNYAGWNSTIYVQNAGANTTTVTVTYRDRNGNPIPAAQESATIAPNSSHVFSQQSNANLGTVLGSAVISGGAGAQLAAIVNIYNADTDNTNAQLLSYTASAHGGTKLYAPRVVNNYYGFNSGLTIQNLDPSQTATVTITFNFPTGSSVLPLTIAPQAAAALYLPDVRINGAPLPSGNANGKGSAVITSTTNIIAIVNEDNRVSPGFIGQGMSYNAFVDGFQTPKAFLPQVTARYYGYASGITIQNAGSAPGSGTITLTAPNGQSQSFPTGTIDAGHQQIYFVPNLWSGNDFNGSATITFSQPIFVIANMSFRGDVDPRYAQPGMPAQYGDSLSAYNAINQSP